MLPKPSNAAMLFQKAFNVFIVILGCWQMCRCWGNSFSSLEISLLLFINYHKCPLHYS